MNLKEALQKLLNSDYIITFEDWGYSKVYGGVYPYFNLYVMNFRDGSVKISKIICEEHPYWNERKSAYAMKVYGVDRYNLIYRFTNDVKLTSELMKKVIIL